MSSLSNLFAQSEVEATKRDALSSEARTPEERIAVFIDLLESVEAIRASISPEEWARRKRIADQLQPLPRPWWRNCRKEALDEFRCPSSS